MDFRDPCGVRAEKEWRRISAKIPVTGESFDEARARMDPATYATWAAPRVHDGFPPRLPIGARPYRRMSSEILATESARDAALAALLEDAVARQREGTRRAAYEEDRTRTCLVCRSAKRAVVLPCACCVTCQGRKRVIQRRFNVGVLEAISERKAFTL